MSLKRDLAKELRMIEAEIQSLEIKRSRSQAALIQALVDHKDPDTTDIGYFRTYTAQIEVKRDRLKEVTKKLEALV
ncbi:MAG: hypothetical protein K2O94_03785 [Clostridiales bacterium]|uniref:hypothetical protein n=1 Tax=Anaerocaecibacter muris TaxID=2941513 RepID=UPI00203BC27D|nr:hypothetical protein [Anaerocaecibacter muris]MDE6966083.1 hypothetical protein [Clostridiales bacterium]